MVLVIAETILTFLELATVFCKFEAVLNSRPWCTVSSEPNDFEALTPGHYLIGHPIVEVSDRRVDEKTNRLSRF